MADDDLGRALAAFLDEHRACGTLATGFAGAPERVWLSCSCGARIERPAATACLAAGCRSRRPTRSPSSLRRDARTWSSCPAMPEPRPGR
jgi:hypothetical protein